MSLDYGRLYELGWPKAMVAARRWVGQDQHRAEDLCQDAWLVVWQKAVDGDLHVKSDGHFVSLWCRSVRWRFGDEVGHHRVQRELLLTPYDDDDKPMERLQDPSQSAEDVVMAWLGGDAVEALSLVNPPGRSVLVARILKGYSAAEIAEQFAYTNTVQVRNVLSRAMADLRARYAEVTGEQPVVFVPRLSTDRCVRGHEWREETTHIRGDGGRQCILCRRETDREWKRNNRHGKPDSHRRTPERLEKMREYSRRSYLKKKAARQAEREAAGLVHHIDPVEVLKAMADRD